MEEKRLELLRYRVMAARARGALDAGNSALAAEYSACATLFRQEILDCLSAIRDENTRNVFVLRYLHGLEWQEIATRMNFSERWVLKLHQRGLEIL